MEVLEFMNTHDNWEELLTQPPYNIIVKRDEEYILLKYNQLSSDFSIPIVRECRGSIFYKNENGKYECVARAFDKFGNYGESYVPKIDWHSAVVEEKVDGSLMKVWHHNNKWHISTNGTINAHTAEVDDTGWTFGRLFDIALGNELTSYFFTKLDKNMTYMFELVSPRSRCTIFYPETKLYYLGQRDMHTMEEYKDYNSTVMSSAGVLFPKVYPLTTIEECLEYVQNMTKDEEGFVIRDKYFNRIKLKSPQYLMAFHMNNNGAITVKRIITMMKNNMIDDFMAYCPEYNDMVNEVLNDIKEVARSLESIWGMCAWAAKCDKKTFACAIRNFPYNAFLFEKYNHPELTGVDYIMSRPIKQIKSMIERSKQNEH